MGVMLVRLDEGARVVGFDRVDEGGQTGRDVSEDMDDAPAMAEHPAADGSTPQAPQSEPGDGEN